MPGSRLLVNQQALAAKALASERRFQAMNVIYGLVDRTDADIYLRGPLVEISGSMKKVVVMSVE